MPLDHDHLHLERSVASHDAEAVEPGAAERDAAAIDDLLNRHRVPAGPLLDIGCGSGRHLRALAALGRNPLIGVDCDQRMLAAASAGLPAGCQLVQADASRLQRGDLPGATGCAAALLFNRSLVCFHSHRLALGLFRSVADLLLPGGLFCLDDPSQALWDQIRAGDLADGLSPDGEQQCFFLPGENRFVWRRGAEVDPDCWHVHHNDRLYRCWSRGEIALAAEAAGLALISLSDDSGFIVLGAPRK